MLAHKAVSISSVEQPAALLPPKPGVYRNVSINLEDIEEETRCAVCLGVIKDARLIAQCMHRFCAACIEKWLRQSKQNDCPQCRKPMQSRRDCKSDPRFDRLVALLFKDVDEYEKQQVDQEALDKAFQLGAKLSRLQEHRKASMPRIKRGPLSAARASGGPTWSPEPHAPAATDRASTSRSVNSSGSADVQQGSHKRIRKSRHGRQEALHVPLEDEAVDLSGYAQMLMLAAQSGLAQAAVVALQLLPHPKAKGLKPLANTFISAPASATISDLTAVLEVLHKSSENFNISGSSSLRDPGRFLTQKTAQNSTEQEGQNIIFDRAVRLIDLSAARQDVFTPLFLFYSLKE